MIAVADITRPDEKREAFPWSLPVRHFSASSLRMAAECPEKYRQRYILGAKEKPGAPRVVGNAVHGALAINFDEKKKTGDDLTSMGVEAAYAEAWDSAVRKSGGAGEIDWGNDGAEAHLRKGLEITQLYVETVAPRIRPIAVESRFNLKLIPGIPPLLGFIDLIHEGGVTDYKTSGRKVTSSKPEWKLQGWIYQMVVPQEFSWHVITKAKEPTIWTPLEAPDLAMSYSEVQMKFARRYIYDLAHTLNYYYLTLGEEQPWPATGLVGDGSCVRCDYRSQCPAWRGYV